MQSDNADCSFMACDALSAVPVNAAADDDTQRRGTLLAPGKGDVFSAFMQLHSNTNGPADMTGLGMRD